MGPGRGLLFFIARVFGFCGFDNFWWKTYLDVEHLGHVLSASKNLFLELAGLDY